jgi:DNA-binding GntR family transcriptional regulator
MATRHLSGVGPIFKQLARHLSEPIESGGIPVGDLLPTEDEIARRHGVSRHTVRQALARLRSLGLIESRQGVGSIVVRSTPKSMFSETFASVDELIRTGRGTPLRTHSVEDVFADAKLSEELRGREGQSYLRIIGTRPTTTNSNARAVGYVEVFVDAIYSGVRSALPTLKTTIAEAINAAYSVSIDHIEQDITVSLFTKDQAKILGVKAKTPALKIQRWYYAGSGRPFEIATSYYPMGDFKYRSVLRRN